MIKNNSNIVGALILAAGSSERMGTPKPFLKYDNHSLFIEKIIDIYLDFGCNQIVITIPNNSKQWKIIEKKYSGNNSILFIPNIHPEYERFYSIQIGLLEMNEVHYCFLQNVDNPFVSKIVLDSLLTRRKANAFVVPNYMKKGGHPILLGDNVMNYILSINNHNSNLKDVLNDCQRIDCNVNDPKILIDINTQNDYKKNFGKIND